MFLLGELSSSTNVSVPPEPLQKTTGNAKGNGEVPEVLCVPWSSQMSKKGSALSSAKHCRDVRTLLGVSPI